MRILYYIFFFITCCTLKAFTQTNVSGNVFGTWAKANSPYVITGDVTVQSGRTLTIEPGVEIRCSNYSYDISVSGTLIAKGTAADSIKFKGFANPTVSAQSTHAGSIKFEQNSLNSQLEYVNIDRWGDVNYSSSYGAVHINSSSVTISKSTVRNSEEYGIRIEYYALTPAISNNTFINNPYGIRIYNRTGMSPTIISNNFVNTPVGITGYIDVCSNTSANTNAVIQLLGVTTGQDGILQKQGTNSYFKLGNSSITIRQGDTLEIKPGVEIRSYRYDDYISINGVLIAKGTPTDSIRFRGFASPSVSVQSTHGGSLRFYTSQGNSQLEYVNIDRWGDANYGISGAIYISSSNVNISKSTIRNSEEYGIRMDYDAPSPIISNNSFINNPYGIKLSRGPASPTITNNNFVNTPIGITGYIHVCSNIYANTNAVIQLLGERTNQDGVLQKQGANSYYRLENSGTGFTIRQGDTLVIKPGVEIRSYHYSDNIRVEGTLIAKGMAADSIKFRGFANPMVSNLSTHGGYLSFESSSTNSQLEYIDIDRWGDATFARYSSTVYINTPGIVISKSTIRNSETNGIYIDYSSGSPTISNNSFINNISGIKISSTAGSGGSSTVSPTVSNNEFINTPTGITTPIHTCSNIFSNTNAVIQLLGGSTYHNGVLQKQGVNSFFKLSGFTTEIRQGNIIEIKPGVEIRSYNYYDRISVYGTLIAKGIAADSIRFIGFANPTASVQSTHGGSIEFQSGSLNSQLEYVNIDHWGDANSTNGAVFIGSSSLTISKSTIRNSEEYGIRMSFNAYSNIINPTIANNNFSNNPLGDITTYPNSLGNVLNNTNAKIIINPGNLLANMSWPYPGTGSYYILTNRTTIPAAFTLTIGAGSLIDFGQNAELYVEGTLKAIGTELTPIQFVRLQDPTSNIYGGRVYLRPTSTNSVINYVFFDKLGSTNSSEPVLDVATDNFSISNITISNSPVVGLRYTATGKPTISSSNFINNKTGISVSSGSPIFTNCNIYGNTEFGINNTSSAVADTVDARNCYWGHSSGPLHATLNPGGLGNKVSNKVKFNPWRNQPQNGQIIDLGISTLLTPISDCNLTNSQPITVRIRNYGNVSPGNFQVSYRINNGMVITETVSSGSLLPGKSLDYTFNSKANVSATGTYTFMAYSNISQDALFTNDTLKTQIQHYLNVASPVNLIPANNSGNLDIPVTLSWSAVPNATGYDVFVWKSTDPVPTQPTASNLNQTSYLLPASLLTYGTDYKWKIAARRVNCRAESSIQTFTTRQLPDLIVESVTGPANATSETNITFYWKIKNQGTGSTGSSGWQDVAYLCDQPTLSASTEKFYIGSVPNFSALAAGQLYQSTNFTYRMPQGIQGVYYLIVQCNPSQSSKETSTSNNQKSSTAITVSLSPPPDLQVTSVVVSLQNLFSEDSLRVTYKVKNAGTGPTTQSSWSDYIYLSQNEILNTNSATFLSSYQRNQTLAVGSEYTVIAKTKLPARINGTYYVHVYTDRFNAVFEYDKEDNNITNSLPLSVVQRPTPDLKISSINIGVDSISNNQPVTVQWTTTNDGAIAAKPNWQEYIYLSNDAVFNESTDRYAGSLTRTTALNSLSSSSAQQSITVPATLAEGNYYFFVKTDASNSIYESPEETNNISSPSSLVRIVNADLKPTLLTSPNSALSEQEITIQWTIKNDSRAIIQNRSWTDKLYLSSNATFESGTDLLLSSVNNSQLLSKAGEYTKQVSVKLPVGISGNYFLLLVSDANNDIFEKLENNNLISKSITLSLAPWPDILGTNITLPASDTIGTSIRIQYSAKNNGAGTILNGSWTDNIYLSKTNNPNETNLVLLGSILQKRSLTGNETYTQITTFSLPSTLTAGQYYVFVKTDFTNLIFENTGETNNTLISTTTVNLFATSALSPIIDLSVIAGQLQTAAVTAGQSVTIQWQVKNNSSFSTLSSSWKDAVYLSSNPTLDVSDVLLSMVTITSPLAAGATYTQNQTVAIPQDASGTLYLLVNTDKDNQNNDDNRGNNTLALNSSGGGQGIVITIPPPADLVPVSFTVPAEGVAAQPVNISFTIKNQGAGPTPTGNWIDHIYLSTDFQLGNDDILIGSLPHTGSQTSGSQYTASGQFFIPNSASGNYVLLLKSDANDLVFERNNEGNNLAFSNILINPQQPSDLIVSEITIPTGEQYAGSKATIQWKLKNVGVNIANGIKRDAVYFSKDSVLDATDVLFGVAEKTIYLPSQSTDNNSLTGVLANISVGSYYVILKTDILNNITEIDNDNNQAVSVGKVIINIKDLLIGVEKRDTITKSEPLYYRIEIPQNLANETLKVNLSGENNAVNRLYITYNQTPTSNSFDFESTIPFKSNQSIVIPQLKPGTYYLLALGEDPAKIKQPITLLATVIPFAVTDITAKEGGNTGLITVKISGAKFDAKTTFRLRKSPSETILPNKVYIIDQTASYVTFNLTGKSVGNYDVLAVKENGETATLSNGFTVVQGPAGSFDGNGSGFVCNISNVGFEEGLETALVAPAFARRGQIVSFTVSYKNTGTVDVPVQTRFLISLNENIPVGFSLEELSEKKQDLILVCEEKEGPPGILRPGAGGFFKVYAVSSRANIDVTIIE